MISAESILAAKRLLAAQAPVDPASTPLMMYESEALRLGMAPSLVESAKLTPQPIPADLLPAGPYMTFAIIGSIPT